MRHGPGAGGARQDNGKATMSYLTIVRITRAMHAGCRVTSLDLIAPQLSAERSNDMTLHRSLVVRDTKILTSPMPDFDIRSMIALHCMLLPTLPAEPNSRIQVGLTVSESSTLHVHMCTVSGTFYQMACSRPTPKLLRQGHVRHSGCGCCSYVCDGVPGLQCTEC